MPSSHLILCYPLLLLPPIPPIIRVFSNESTLHMRWPKYWSFSFSISLSNEHPGLISFRMDWLDLLAVQGTCKSLLQKGTLLHCWWECKLVQPLWRTVWRFLKKLKIDIILPSVQSVQFSRSVMSDSLRPHELQHARPPCPSPTPGVHSDSRPSSQ